MRFLLYKLFRRSAGRDGRETVAPNGNPLAPACLLGIACMFSGCDLANPQPREQQTVPAEANEALEPAKDAAPSEPAPPVLPAPPAPPAPGPEGPKTEQVELKEGFTGKGQYGQGGGEKPMDLLTVPIGQHFTVRERLLLMQIQDAENKFKAMNDDKLPATHEEYMEKIIKENMIKLPNLDDGQRYLFDPKQGKLMIEKPK